MRCSRCKRPLKTGTIGPVCARLGLLGSGTSSPAPPRVRIYLLGRRPDGTRNWIVFEQGREFRVEIGPRRAKCWTCRRSRCGHVEKVKAKEIENAKH